MHGLVVSPVRRVAEQWCEHHLQSSYQEVGLAIALKKCGDLLVLNFDFGRLRFIHLLKQLYVPRIGYWCSWLNNFSAVIDRL